MFSQGELQALAAPMGNHLWQSTLFGLAAAAATLLLKKSEARFRFWLWFVASLKFLVPFSVLIWIGRRLGAHLERPAQQALASFVEVAAQPFAHALPRASQSAPWQDQLSARAPALVALLWLVGAVVVMLLWGLRWLQVFRVQNAATCLQSGPEVELLDTLTHSLKTRPLSVLLSGSCVEPGVFGVFRPVLLWPANLSAELSEPQLAAILAHEVWHVRRRDNLTAAVQLWIEALFWFHPLVWWSGVRQMEEREHACDERVLSLGSLPVVYAESILKTCKFCLEAPRAIVAGVNGSNLQKRITQIMRMQNSTKLSSTRKTLLGSLLLSALSLPLFFGVLSTPQGKAQGEAQGEARGEAQANASSPSSEAVRVTALRRATAGDAMMHFQHTPGETSISNTTVRRLIEMAYALKDYQLSGGPGWIDQDRFDLTFTGGAPLQAGESIASSAALKEILAQRFHLALRQESRPGTVLALIVGPGGARFSPVTPVDAPGTNEPLLGIRVLEKDGHGEITLTGDPSGLADTLSSQVGYPILNKTGLAGIYSIHFHWTTNPISVESLSAALEQQLGLVLSPEEGTVATSTIDNIVAPAHL